MIQIYRYPIEIISGGLWIIEDADTGKVLGNATSRKTAKKKAIELSKKLKKDLIFYKVMTIKRAYRVHYLED